MTPRTHEYELELLWTGNLGAGTASYRGYSRRHELRAPAAPAIPGTADPAFRGEAERWNPEQLLLGALAQCHMLWYLHLASAAGVVVTGYQDRPHGVLRLDDDGGGRFTAARLRPRVRIAPESCERTALRLHGEVPEKCFIARSLAFPVRHEPVILREG